MSVFLNYVITHEIMRVETIHFVMYNEKGATSYVSVPCLYTYVRHTYINMYILYIYLQLTSSSRKGFNGISDFCFILIWQFYKEIIFNRNLQRHCTIRVKNCWWIMLLTKKVAHVWNILISRFSVLCNMYEASFWYFSDITYYIYM